MVSLAYGPERVALQLMHAAPSGDPAIVDEQLGAEVEREDLQHAEGERPAQDRHTGRAADQEGHVGDESAVNRSDSNRGSAVGRARDKVRVRDVIRLSALGFRLAEASGVRLSASQSPKPRAQSLRSFVSSRPRQP